MKRDKKKKTSIDYFGKISFFQIPIPGGRIPQKIAIKCFYPNVHGYLLPQLSLESNMASKHHFLVVMEVMNTKKTFSEGV